MALAVLPALWFIWNSIKISEIHGVARSGELEMDGVDLNNTVSQAISLWGKPQATTLRKHLCIFSWKDRCIVADPLGDIVKIEGSCVSLGESKLTVAELTCRALAIVGPPDKRLDNVMFYNVSLDTQLGIEYKGLRIVGLQIRERKKLLRAVKLEYLSRDG